MKKSRKQHAYYHFLQSQTWKIIRQACLSRDNHQCTKCHTTQNLQAHHTSYPDRWENTALHQLTTLCRKCHQAEHQTINKRRQRKARKQKPRLLRKLLKRNWQNQAKPFHTPNDPLLKTLQKLNATINDPLINEGLTKPQKALRP